MDIMYFLSSINKLSVIAFLITLGVLVFEVRLLKKERKSRTKPKIPEFRESANLQVTPTANLITSKEEKISKPNNLIIIILIILMIVFGIATVLGYSNYNKKNSASKITQTPVVNFITSKGIKIFDSEFNPISDTYLNQLDPGVTIHIGIETIKGADIDRARIRINENNWQSNHVTVDFIPKYQIYYIKYQVATDESKLNIEAQLHSATDGWLGD